MTKLYFCASLLHRLQWVRRRCTYTGVERTSSKKSSYLVDCRSISPHRNTFLVFSILLFILHLTAIRISVPKYVCLYIYFRSFGSRIGIAKLLQTSYTFWIPRHILPWIPRERAPLAAAFPKQRRSPLRALRTRLRIVFRMCVARGAGAVGQSEAGPGPTLSALRSIGPSGSFASTEGDARRPTPKFCEEDRAMRRRQGKKFDKGGLFSRFHLSLGTRFITSYRL